MSKKEIIEKVDRYASERGLTRNKHYSWLWKGPTFVYHGNQSPHHGLTIGDIKHIQKLGALFAST